MPELGLGRWTPELSRIEDVENLSSEAFELHLVSFNFLLPTQKAIVFHASRYYQQYCVGLAASRQKTISSEILWTQRWKVFATSM